MVGSIILAVFFRVGVKGRFEMWIRRSGIAVFFFLEVIEFVPFHVLHLFWIAWACCVEIPEEQFK